MNALHEPATAGLLLLALIAAGVWINFLYVRLTARLVSQVGAAVRAAMDAALVSPSAPTTRVSEGEAQKRLAGLQADLLDALKLATGGKSPSHWPADRVQQLATALITRQPEVAEAILCALAGVRRVPDSKAECKGGKS